MPESTETKTQSASDVLLAAMSRSDIYSPEFLAMLNRQGLSAETFHEATEERMRALENTLKNTVVWPEDDLITEEMVERVAAQRTPSQVFSTSELAEWAFDNGFTDEEE